MTETELINYYAKQRLEGKDLSLIKKELQNKGIESDRVKILSDSITKHEIRIAQIKIEKNKQIGFILMGGVLFLLGIGITIKSFIETQSQYLLWYGAIIIGLSMMAGGAIKVNQLNKQL